MSTSEFSDEEIVAYLDEQLSVERMAAVEQALRGSDALRQRTAGLARRRDQGVHSVGEIWRRLRLSCPSRKELGSYLLGALDGQPAEYIEFHIGTVGCRLCAANLDDLQQQMQSDPATQNRRRRFFESSAGYLHK